MWQGRGGGEREAAGDGGGEHSGVAEGGQRGGCPEPRPVGAAVFELRDPGVEGPGWVGGRGEGTGGCRGELEQRAGQRGAAAVVEGGPVGGKLAVQREIGRASCRERV